MMRASVKRIHETQNERRSRLLSDQQLKRRAISDQVRRLAMEADSDKMDVEKAPTKALNPAYQNQLMLAEPMQETPGDFPEQWTLIPVPQGQRLFLISAQGKTRVYSVDGERVETFQSGLPGGSSGTSRSPQDYCVLDCVRTKNQDFYVLDMMMFRGHPLYDCEAEFRHFWIQSRLSECEIINKTQRNQYSILILPALPVHTMDAMTLSSCPYETDYIMCIHKQSHYIPGPSPVCLRLELSALPSLFNLSQSQMELAHPVQ